MVRGNVGDRMTQRRLGSITLVCLITVSVLSVLALAGNDYCSDLIDPCEVHRSISDTPTAYVWPVIPVGITTVMFHLSSSSDARITLSSLQSDVNDMYIIDLEDSVSGISFLRLCQEDGPCIKAATDTGDLLTVDQNLHFYISFENGNIAIGLVGEEPFLSYNHVTPFTVRYIGIASRNGAQGEWTFCGMGDCWWTPWIDRDDPGTTVPGSDDETLQDILQSGIPVCDYAIPFDIQCRQVGSVDDSIDTSVWILDIPCTPEVGLRCVNSQQNAGNCPDFEVRFKCRYRTQTVLYPDVTPVYLGCYIYSTDTLNDGNLVNAAMTLEMCFTHCKLSGSRYAGTRSNTMCFCGNDGAVYDNEGLADNDVQCNGPCGGNVGQICGAEWRISIYDITEYLTCVTSGPLGMESGLIENSQITQSTYYHTNEKYIGWNGRLNNGDNKRWSSVDSDTNPWIQVDFLTRVIMEGILTQGCGSSDKEWLKTLKIQTGDTESLLEYIMEGGQPKIFTANSDKDSVVSIEFPVPVYARYLRIIPVTNNNWISLRFEVTGCHKASQLMFSYPLGAEGICNGALIDYNLDATTKTAIDYRDGESNLLMKFYDSPETVDNSCGLAVTQNSPIPANLGNFEYTCVANPDLCDNGMTWVMWLYVPSSREYSSVTEYLISCYDNGHGVHLTQIPPGQGISQYRYKWTVSYSSITMEAYFVFDPASTWIHLGVSYSSQSLKIFVNGIEQILTLLSTSPVSLTSPSAQNIPLYLGQKNPSEVSSIGAGVFSNLQIYDKELTADDIKILSQCETYANSILQMHGVSHIVLNSVSYLICDVAGYFNKDIQWTYTDVMGNNMLTLTNGQLYESDGVFLGVSITEEEPGYCRVKSMLQAGGTLHPGVYSCSASAGNQQVLERICFETDDTAVVLRVERLTPDTFTNITIECEARYHEDTSTVWFWNGTGTDVLVEHNGVTDFITNQVTTCRSTTQLTILNVGDNPRGIVTCVLVRNNVELSRKSLTIANIQPECVQPVGMEDGAIAADALTASSAYRSNYGPERARLNQLAYDGYKGAWSPLDLDDCWIQVTFGTQTNIWGVILQGRADLTSINPVAQWVTQYYVNYTRLLDMWETVADEHTGDSELFDGNTDANTTVTQYFPNPIDVYQIRIIPHTWTNYASLRFELLGEKPCPDTFDVVYVEIWTNSSISLGTDVHLYCSVNGYGPPPNITWTRESRAGIIDTIDPTTNVISLRQVSPSLWESDFILRTYGDEDDGSYTCIAGNNRVASIPFDIQGAKLLDLSSWYDTITSQIRLDCAASGEPLPLIQWWSIYSGDDNIIVDTPDKYTVITTTEVTSVYSTLLVHNYNVNSDSAYFKCTIESSISNVIQDEEHLIVAIPKIQTFKSVYDGATNTYDIKCHALGYPAPTITWYWNDTLIGNLSRMPMYSEIHYDPFVMTMSYESNDPRYKEKSTLQISDFEIGLELPEYCCHVKDTSSQILMLEECLSVGCVCDRGYIYYGGSCYRIETGMPLSRSEASYACQEEGGHLVDIQSQAEQDFIERNFESGNGGIWIGLYGYPLPKWSDGSTPMYTLYTLGREIGQEPCFKVRGVDYTWAVKSCTSSIAYACEKEVISIALTEPATPITGTAVHLVCQVNGSCIQEIHWQHKLFDDDLMPLLLSGVTTVIDDGRQINTLVINSYNADDEGVYSCIIKAGNDNITSSDIIMKAAHISSISSTYDPLNNEYSLTCISDGNPAPDISWRKGGVAIQNDGILYRIDTNLTTSSPRENLMSTLVMKGFQYNSSDVSLYQCKATVSSVFADQKTVDLLLPSTLVSCNDKLNGECYIAVRDHVDWQTARTTCEMNYLGELAPILNAEEHIFIKEMIIRDLSDAESTLVWLGEKRSGDTWNTINDGSNPYTFWVVGEPRPASTGRNCMVHDIADVGSSTLSCISTASYVCKYNEMQVISNTSTISSTSQTSISTTPEPTNPIVTTNIASDVTTSTHPPVTTNTTPGLTSTSSSRSPTLTINTSTPAVTTPEMTTSSNSTVTTNDITTPGVQSTAGSTSAATPTPITTTPTPLVTTPRITTTMGTTTISPCLDIARVDDLESRVNGRNICSTHAQFVKSANKAVANEMTEDELTTLDIDKVSDFIRRAPELDDGDIEATAMATEELNRLGSTLLAAASGADQLETKLYAVSKIEELMYSYSTNLPKGNCLSSKTNDNNKMASDLCNVNSRDTMRYFEFSMESSYSNDGAEDKFSVDWMEMPGIQDDIGVYFVASHARIEPTLPTSAANTDDDEVQLLLNSDSVTFTMWYNGSKLSLPCYVKLQHKQKVDTRIPTEEDDVRPGTLIKESLCVFWDEMASNWSSYGCERIAADSSHWSTSCYCNHTTSFAVLMQVRPYPISKADTIALTWITYIGCATSLCVLFFTLCIFFYLREFLYSERVFIHKNLILSIILAQCLFLGGIDQTENQNACKAVAVFLHLSYLAVFSWMLVEGVHLYIKVVRVFGSEDIKVMPYLIIGWGVPCVITGISFGAGYDGYGSEKSCWLDTSSGLIWAFVAPALFVILINLVILGLVVRIVIKSAKFQQDDRDRFNHVKAGLRGAVLLLPILGVTWVFGLLAVNSETILFAYLFTIFNSFQGVFIFILHCLFNAEVRVAWRKKKAREESIKIACSTVPEGATVTEHGTIVFKMAGDPETRMSSVGPPVSPAPSSSSEIIEDAQEDKDANDKNILGDSVDNASANDKTPDSGLSMTTSPLRSPLQIDDVSVHARSRLTSAQSRVETPLPGMVE